MMRTKYLTFIILVFTFTVSYTQPTIDGVFDGVGIWGNATANADGNPGWASANLDKLYVTNDGTYLYLGVTLNQAADWQSWGIIINRSPMGSPNEVWGYPITYGHMNQPDLVVKGHFGQGGSPYAEVRDWNGSSFVRKDNTGMDAGLNTADFFADETGMIEIRLLLSTFGNPTTGDIQVYLSGNVSSEHATFDALPDDEVATSWNDLTTLDNFVTNINLGGSPIVTVSPANPNDNEPVTINFDANSTSLAGVTKVYLHAGVSTTHDDLFQFDEVTGNWGEDDGIGEMTNIGSDLWEIVIPDLRSYFNVENTDDVFGLNFLFRNIAGDTIEDQSASNYHEPTDPGPYFITVNPLRQLTIEEVNNTVSCQFDASVLPTSWSLDEVDDMGNVLANIGTAGAISTYMEDIDVLSASLKRYKITCVFSSITKFKYFEILGYNSVQDSIRPAWTQPGINYHSDDSTKATLVLHAPTYTRYFQHPQGMPPLLTGTNTTTNKEVVYAVGDFNNWVPSESYKLYRDTDGWNENSQMDADGDDDRGDYWWIELTGLVPGQEYVFQYLTNDGIQVGDPYSAKISDVDDQYISSERYPNLISYPSEAEDRASVFQTNQDTFNWTAPNFTPPNINELNIYELHFRDFTEEGTYAAAIERLDYLKALGINAIHVMPVSEFEGNSSWGYNPNFYFAPDKYYGTSQDLKHFIDQCHIRELLVFNDLVLNHAFYSNSMARLYWNEIDNKPANDNPWFNHDHKMIADMAGWWGADWNHESEHTQVFVDRILDFWLQEYKFDGFRFDFTKGFGQTAPDANDPWASSYDQDRIDLLLRMVEGMKSRNPGAVAIFEHLADSSEDAALADTGILMWSGVEHHNKVKDFMLGWNGEDIYSSGIYNAQGFTYANWMSYMESHDEERQAYEVTENGNITYTTENLIDRLKIGAAFNLLFPGPRMIWQFEELAYDISIDFNGRTGEKPVKWEYYFDSHRKELWRLISQILYIRNNFDIYNGTPDYGNIGSISDVDEPRRMTLTDGAGNFVIVISNLDPDLPHVVSPQYGATGTWYRYNGDEMIDGTPLIVNDMSDTYNLTPSETLILTNFDIGWSDDCSDPLACCVKSVYTWIGGNSDWNIASNWDTGAIPKPCDMVIIPSGNVVTIQTGQTGYANHVWTQDGATLLIEGELNVLHK